MLCAPIDREKAINMAVPLVKAAGGPMLLPTSLNCTVPVGVPDPGGAAATVAVKVTAWPNDEGFAEEETLVELPSWFTVCIHAGLVLPAKLPSPP